MHSNANPSSSSYRPQSLNGKAAVVEHVTEEEMKKIEKSLKDPIIIRKQATSANTYRQNISIRFLKPPTPEPETIIVKEIMDEEPDIRAAPIRIIRQREERERTPSPLILREKPPTPPVKKEPKVIIKRIPSSFSKRREGPIIVEKQDHLPPKPRDIIIERWLPYSENREKKYIHVKENEKRDENRRSKRQELIVRKVKQKPKIKRELLVDGVIKIDPNAYIKHYGKELVDMNTISEQLNRVGLARVLNIADERLNHNLSNRMAKNTTKNKTSNHRGSNKQQQTPSSSFTRIRQYELEADADLNEFIKKLNDQDTIRTEHSTIFNLDTVKSKEGYN